VSVRRKKGVTHRGGGRGANGYSWTDQGGLKHHADTELNEDSPEGGKGGSWVHGILVRSVAGPMGARKREKGQKSLRKEGHPL